MGILPPELDSLDGLLGDAGLGALGVAAAHCVEADAGEPEKDATDFGIRVCGDYVEVNKCTVRLQANAPNVPFQIERASGRHAYWYTDGFKQYNGWLVEEKTQEIMAVWTPRGLLAPTRMQFGAMNAGVVAQGACLAEA